MISDPLLLCLLLSAMIVLLAFYQQHSARIFAGSMLVTLVAGWISPEVLLKNASNSGLATLVLLILVSIALEKTSMLRRIARILFSPSEKLTLLRTVGLASLSSSVLNNTAVVATLLNAVRSNRFVAPSRLLIPLSYAAIMGGTLTLIGTSTNLIVNSMLTETGHPGFHFFDFTPVGIIVLAGGSGVLFCVSCFLPRHPIEQRETTQYFLEAQLEENSPLVGRHVEDAGLRHLEDLFLAEIIRASSEVLRPVARYDVLQAGDRLLFSGDVGKVMILNQFPGLKLFADENGLQTHALTEVLVKDESAIVGMSLKSSGFRARFDAAVVAVRREGERVTGKLGELQIQSGDFLLLATGPDFASRTNLSKNFFVLSGVEPEHMLSGWREKFTIWGFLLMIALTVVTGASLFVGVLFFLSTLLISGCLNVNEIKRRFPVEIWLIVTSALCIASSLQSTGLSRIIADFAASTLSGHAPLVTLIGIFLITYILTELITNNAAAALMFPIAYSLALGLGVDPFPLVLGVAFAASASFITPYGYQTNLMVFNASTYRLKHFLFSGIPVAITYIVLSITAIAWIYPF